MTRDIGRTTARLEYQRQAWLLAPCRLQDFYQPMTENTVVSEGIGAGMCAREPADQDAAGLAQEWRHLQDAQDFIASLFINADADVALMLPRQRGPQGCGALRTAAS